MTGRGWHRLHINFRIISVVIFCIQVFLYDPQSIAETLEMNDLACAKELDWISNVGIVDQSKQIIICRACLLLGRKILKKIGDRVPLDLQ